MKGLLEHEHRPQWMPGGGGLCLHTIVLDPANPDRMGDRHLDGGLLPHGRRRRDLAAAQRTACAPCSCPNKYPEFGQCVHKVAHHPSRPERLFLQNHWGLYRSDDWGDSWQDIANGVPSDFGFAMPGAPARPRHGLHRSRSSRTSSASCPRRSSASIARGTRARRGRRSTDGLPQEHAFESVLRDGLAVDTHDPAGVYFGTRSGKLYASRTTTARQWKAIADALPPICCVKTAVVGPPDARASRGRLHRAAARAHALRARRRHAAARRAVPDVRDALAQTAPRGGRRVIDRVLTEQGDLRRHVNVFVGDESIALPRRAEHRGRRGRDDHDRAGGERRVA